MTDQHATCGAPRGVVYIGSQRPQWVSCEDRAGHDGPHRAGVLDSDDNPITERWTS